MLLYNPVDAQEIRPKYWNIDEIGQSGDGTFFATLELPVKKEETKGWNIGINFENIRLKQLKAYTAKVNEVNDADMRGYYYTLTNQRFNGHIRKGQTLKISLIGQTENPLELPTDENAPIIDFQGETYDGQVADLDDTMELMTQSFGLPSNDAYRLKPDDIELNELQLKRLLEKSLLFFDAQRSGPISADPGYRIVWRQDSALLDGTDVGMDLTGGFYVGGDHIKFNYPIAHMVTVLSWSVKRHSDVYFDTESAGGDKMLGNAYKILKWGADYIMKCHPTPDLLAVQVGTPEIEHTKWTRAEQIDELSQELERKTILLNRGSDKAQDIASEMSAALAAFSIVARQNQTYYHMLLDKAQSLYKFALDSPGSYDSNHHTESIQQHYKSISPIDEQVWAEVWLYVATNEEKYLNAAVDNINKHQELKNEIPQEFSYDDKRAGIHAILSQYTRVYDDYENSNNIVKQFCSKFLPNGDYEINEVGMPMIDDYNNMGLAAGMAFICIYTAESLEKEDENMALNFYHLARNVVAFGAGSTKQSYMVGYTNSRSGIFSAPKHVHHRSSTCPMLPAPCGWEEFDDPLFNRFPIIGAVVGGPGPTKEWADKRGNYWNNQPDILTNAYYQSAVAALLKYEFRIHGKQVKVKETMFRDIFVSGIIRVKHDFCNRFSGINPCKHDGICVDIGEWGFACECLNGYTGDRCEIRTFPEPEWENKWGNGGIINIKLPEQHQLYDMGSWVLRITKPITGCDVQHMAVWNACLDYQVSNIKRSANVYLNTFHHRDGKVGFKFERNTHDAAKTAKCFDLENWKFEIVKTLIHNDGTYFDEKCPDRLPWTKKPEEEQSLAMEVIGQDQLDQLFLDRITQYAQDTKDGTLGYWQKAGDINLEWIGYDSEAAWMLIWLPADKQLVNNGKDFAVRLRFPEFCHISGAVVLMACGSQTTSTQTLLPTAGGILEFKTHPDYSDSPFYALKMYIDRSGNNENYFDNCLYVVDYKVNIINLNVDIANAECQAILPPDGGFLNLGLDSSSAGGSSSGGNAQLEAAETYGSTGKGIHINILETPDDPWALNIKLPVDCHPKEIAIWHGCLIEKNSDIGFNSIAATKQAEVEIEMVGWNIYKDYIGMSITVADDDVTSGCWNLNNWEKTFRIKDLANEPLQYNFNADLCLKELKNSNLVKSNYNEAPLNGMQISRLQNKEKKIYKATALPAATIGGYSVTMPGLTPRRASDNSIGGFSVVSSSSAPIVSDMSVSSESAILEFEGDQIADGYIVELVNENSKIDLEQDDSDWMYASYDANEGFGDFEGGTLQELLDIKDSLKLKTGMKREYMVKGDADAIEIDDLVPGVLEEDTLKFYQMQWFFLFIFA